MKKTYLLLIIFVTVCANGVMAAEVPAVKTAVDSAFAPIRIEVTESKFSADNKKDKAELVIASQTMEEMFQDIGMTYDDPALVEYLTKMIPIEHLGEKAPGFYFRVYVLKSPVVNAMATPTGSIYIYSGLLAALQNKDQVRFVMGHEAHHVLDQDIVYAFKDLKQKTSTAKVLTLISAPAVAYAIGEADYDAAKVIANVYTGSQIALNLTYQMSVLGYGRSNEVECDEYAAGVFKQHDYDLNSAKDVFETFEKEHERFGPAFQSHLFSSHETGKQRVQRIEKHIKEGGIVEAEAPVDLEYQKITKEIRILNAELNIKLRQVQHALDDLERLKTHFPDDVRVLFLFAEAYRQLASDKEILKEELSWKTWREVSKNKLEKLNEEWTQKSTDFYEQALEKDPEYADAYRGRGLLKEQLKEYDAAIQNMRTYLEKKPKAKDARYIASKIKKYEKEIENKNKQDQKKQEKKSDQKKDDKEPNEKQS